MKNVCPEFMEQTNKQIGSGVLSKHLLIFLIYFFGHYTEIQNSYLTFYYNLQFFLLL